MKTYGRMEGYSYAHLLGTILKGIVLRSGCFISGERRPAPLEYETGG